MTLKEKCKAIRKEERAELNEIRTKYRILLAEARKDCKHDFSEWYMTPNEEFRYDFFNNIIWLRDCKLCSKSETRHGESSKSVD